MIGIHGDSCTLVVYVRQKYRIGKSRSKKTFGNGWKITWSARGHFFKIECPIKITNDIHTIQQQMTSALRKNLGHNQKSTFTKLKSSVSFSVCLQTIHYFCCPVILSLQQYRDGWLSIQQHDSTVLEILHFLSCNIHSYTEFDMCQKESCISFNLALALLI